MESATMPVHQRKIEMAEICEKRLCLNIHFVNFNIIQFGVVVLSLSHSELQMTIPTQRHCDNKQSDSSNSSDIDQQRITSNILNTFDWLQCTMNLFYLNFGWASRIRPTVAHRPWYHAMAHIVQLTCPNTAVCGWHATMQSRTFKHKQGQREKKNWSAHIYISLSAISGQWPGRCSLAFDGVNSHGQWWR